ncbi:MAG: hypothetical protein U0231_14500 [Nitrospiraceae bacterium]
MPPNSNYLVTEEIVGEADLVALDGGRVGGLPRSRAGWLLHHAGFAHRSQALRNNIRLPPNGEACLI